MNRSGTERHFYPWMISLQVVYGWDKIMSHDDKSGVNIDTNYCVLKVNLTRHS